MSSELYADINPQIGTLAPGLSSLATALLTGPPTFSKYISIPSGHAAAKSSSRFPAL